MSWHRLYRPKTIQGLHLSNIRETLQGFMEKGQIPQVMLFAGPKGTGKTSSARIIGAMLNDPQNEKIIDYQFFNGSKPKKLAYLEPDEKRSFNDRIYRGQSFVVQEMDAA
ncbi:MAG: AAA family ATPase, partial [Candidatus Pacebacteria bacterium]|nr:AAA family ATPase [Candidatus Paceibacterota bacterium]